MDISWYDMILQMQSQFDQMHLDEIYSILITLYDGQEDYLPPAGVKYLYALYEHYCTILRFLVTDASDFNTSQSTRS